MIFIWQIVWDVQMLLILKNRYEQSLFYQTDSSTRLLWLLLWLARSERVRRNLKLFYSLLNKIENSQIFRIFTVRTKLFLNKKFNNILIIRFMIFNVRLTDIKFLIIFNFCNNIDIQSIKESTKWNSLK